MLKKPLNPWPITIAAFFVVFFSGLVTFIVFASTQHVDLVRPDYYEHELRYDQQLARLARAQQLSEPASITYDRERKRFSIHIPACQANESIGQIHLYRPSGARLDQVWPVRLNAAGGQALDASSLRAGLWKVRVDWTNLGVEYSLDQPFVVTAR